MLAMTPDSDASDPSRSSYERFALPYVFKPRLSLAEAAVAAAGALLRIFLGSLLFAVWGATVLFAWNEIRNIILRIAAVLALGALFVILLAFLMLGISALVKMAWPRRTVRP